MVNYKKVLITLSLILIFLRPFVSHRAFGQLDYQLTMVFFLIAIPIIALNKNKIKYNPVDFFILLFIVSIIFSLISSLNIINSLSNIYILIGNFTVYYLIRCFNERQEKNVLKAIILSSIIICCYGTYQYFWGFRDIVESLTRNRVFYPFAYEWLSRKRVFAVFFTPNAFAGFLIMALPLACGIKHLKNNSDTFNKFIPLFIFVLAINLLLTQSLSALFSLILSYCFILLINKTSKAKLILNIIFGLIVATIIFYLRSETDKAFITPFFSIDKRIEYYKEALLMIKQNPLWGIGLGNFTGRQSLFVHNSYLQIWIELGILGIISYLGIIFIAIKTALQKHQADNSLSPLFCAFLAFCIHNLIDFTFFLPEVSWLWWIITALIIS